TTFGIYLLHENAYVRGILWDVVSKYDDIFRSALIIPYTILVLFSVFTACAIIEIIRKNTIERIYAKKVKALTKR
ncbi:MAG: hypothetical protein IKR46_00030, partial [Clostridia bacterium]|nr:hypothetical protein [Clostridia bacterium]